MKNIDLLKPMILSLSIAYSLTSIAEPIEQLIEPTPDVKMSCQQAIENNSAALQQQFKNLSKYLNSQVVGQEELVERVLIAILVNKGHVLLEGPPGLAKTRLVNALANSIHSSFHRIQFVPDLMPSDITGSEIFDQQKQAYNFYPGPLFNNLVLADEINRANAKTQAATLEAMAEGQITVGTKTRKLPDLFMVLATQNPSSQQGTQELPEAQLDRFVMKLKIKHPDREAERKILKLARQEMTTTSDKTKDNTHLVPEDILNARNEVSKIAISDQVEDFILDIVDTTRNPPLGSEIANLLKREEGVSPRGTIALEWSARAHAWLNGRSEVLKEDVVAIVYDVLRHRINLSHEALAQGDSPESMIKKILEHIEK